LGGSKGKEKMESVDIFAKMQKTCREKMIELGAVVW
jgi:hypothetical protein